MTNVVAQGVITSHNDAVPERNTNPLLVLSYFVIFGLWAASQKCYVPYPVHIIVLVTAILYAACHGSLVLRQEPLKNADGSVGERNSETLRKEDAMSFPIVGSLSLFSLYLAFKYLDKDIVNLLIGVYFAVVGCAALTMTLSPLFDIVCPISLKKKIGWEYKVKHQLPTFIFGEDWDLGLEITVVDLLAFAPSVVFCYFYFKSKYWALNNVLGICFCIQGIERFSLGTYKIGAILLVGLFFYDIFWVFGTDVMVTVAKNLDGPIKILFPRSLAKNPETNKLDLSLLGLGDIIIPGFFLALLLRFDAHIAALPTSHTDVHAPFPKPYFHSALFAYVLGLGITLFVMIQFNAAQPALLYLVPACLGSSLLCAALRGELGALFGYSEEEEDEGDASPVDEDKKDN
jgi:minor histocompatibility antigen H13